MATTSSPTGHGKPAQVAATQTAPGDVVISSSSGGVLKFANADGTQVDMQALMPMLSAATEQWWKCKCTDNNFRKYGACKRCGATRPGSSSTHTTSSNSHNKKRSQSRFGGGGGAQSSGSGVQAGGDAQSGGVARFGKAQSLAHPTTRNNSSNNQSIPPPKLTNEARAGLMQAMQQNNGFVCKVCKYININNVNKCGRRYNDPASGYAKYCNASRF